MSSCTIVLLFLLVTFSPGLDQQVISKFNNNVLRIRDVLREAQVSGSLVFSGGCKFQDREGPVPYVGGRREFRTALETLQRMLALNSNIRVAQDPDGMIRMTEANVPH